MLIQLKHFQTQITILVQETEFDEKGRQLKDYVQDFRISNIRIETILKNSLRFGSNANAIHLCCGTINYKRGNNVH